MRRGKRRGRRRQPGVSDRPLMARASACARARKTAPNLGAQGAEVGAARTPQRLRRLAPPRRGERMARCPVTHPSSSPRARARAGRRGSAPALRAAFAPITPRREACRSPFPPVGARARAPALRAAARARGAGRVNLAHVSNRTPILRSSTGGPATHRPQTGIEHASTPERPRIGHDPAQSAGSRKPTASSGDSMVARSASASLASSLCPSCRTREVAMLLRSVASPVEPADHEPVIIYREHVA